MLEEFFKQEYFNSGIYCDAHDKNYHNIVLTEIIEKYKQTKYLSHYIGTQLIYI